MSVRVWALHPAPPNTDHYTQAYLPLRDLQRVCEEGEGGDHAPGVVIVEWGDVVADAACDATPVEVQKGTLSGTDTDEEQVCQTASCTHEQARGNILKPPQTSKTSIEGKHPRM